jgi:hypothetical protein
LLTNQTLLPEPIKASMGVAMIQEHLKLVPALRHSPQGYLSCIQASADARRLLTLDSSANANLVALGARAMK